MRGSCMFVTGVLSPDAEAFAWWCRANGFRRSGDGAESADGRWLAVRVVSAPDLAGLTLDRIDYARDFWRYGDLTTATALEAEARARVRQRPSTGPVGR